MWVQQADVTFIPLQEGGKCQVLTKQKVLGSNILLVYSKEVKHTNVWLTWSCQECVYNDREHFQHLP
jgi:hypothetical protein